MMLRIHTFVVFSFLTLVWPCSAQGHNPCTLGWFGSNCQYKCHCQDNMSCDKTKGCPEANCESGWFGPACQYVDLSSHATLPTPDWLVDSNDTSCNPTTTSWQQVTVHLNRSLPFTWLRLHVNQPDELQLFTVSFLGSTNRSNLDCTGERRGTVSDRILDIHCDLRLDIQKVILSGQGVNYLCSLYISGGRNVALKQMTNQSSRHFPSEKAVDGNTNPQISGGSCTHTSEGNDPRPTWFIIFVRPVRINRYVLYNRQDCCSERLRGFILKSFSSQREVFSYTDQITITQNVYTVIDPNNNQLAEVSVQASHVLTLCETEMYGDTVCADTYGRECEHRCHCANGCFVSTGQCPECRPGFTGDACNQPCSSGSYGPSCRYMCSGNCKMDGNSCNRGDGSCSQGCIAGYTGRTCNMPCPSGMYGSECKSQCSGNCKTDGNNCDHRDGSCSRGCRDGYTRPTCHAMCPSGMYGSECKSQCSGNCKTDGNNCDYRDGSCSRGCRDGYTRPTCHAKCSPGMYGRDCRSTCSGNCKVDRTNCNHIDGHCSQGCVDGYTGRTCHTKCIAGRYGPDCKYNCSGNCKGNVICDFDSGVCPNGCKAGFNGTRCDTQCPAGKYGPGCVDSCSENCEGDGSCHDSSGACSDGCKDGYRGDKCVEMCESGKYGKACNSICSSTCLPVENNNTQSPCHHEHGNCNLGCEAGYEGDQCRTEKEVSGGDDDPPLVAIIVPIAVVLILAVAIIMGVFLWRRRKNTQKPDYRYPPPSNDYNSLHGSSGRATEPEPIAASQSVVINAQPANKVKHEEVATPEDHYANAKVVDDAVTENKVELSPVVDVDGKMKAEPPKTPRKPTPPGKPKPPIKPKPPVKSKNLLKPGASGNNAGEGKKPGGVYYNTVLALSSTSIAVADLDNFVATHDKDFFKEQFEAIPTNKEATTKVAASAENRMKNRYKNICAYDHSRVHLHGSEKTKQEGYINACYVEGYNGEEMFIASQGPTQAILKDFVCMLWEQNVERVVMLTNLVEEGKVKCERYWPEEGEMDVGDVKVRLTTTNVFADYTIRRLQLSKEPNGKPTKELIQFHFTSWPDKDVPLAPWGLVDFEQRVASYPTQMPTVVHCSAGVGRTGTFIALRNVMREAELTGQMDFFVTVQKLRVNRMNMVQTADQYEFLHKAAQVAMVCMGTTVTAMDVQERVETLEQTSETGETNMNKEFREVCIVCDDKDDTSDSQAVDDGQNIYQNSRSIDNKRKNRLSNILPKDYYRVMLSRESEEMGDYINAVFVPSFAKLDHQILTQLPLPTTVTDFWRMVIQYKVALIVAFDVNPAEKDTTIGEYLTKDGSGVTKFPPFEIDAGRATCGNLVDKRNVFLTIDIETTLRMSSYASFEDGHQVTHLSCKTSDLNPAQLLDLAKEIRSHRSANDRRTLYMCRNGADLSGLICVVLLLLDRMDNDQRLTVPLVVGAIKTIRPQVIPTLEQYKLLYEILRLYNDMSNVYGNIGESPKKRRAPLGSAELGTGSNDRNTFV